MSPGRNSTYYNNDCTLVLQVENELFKIDTSRLSVHSEVFKNMLSLPSGPNSTEGSSDQDPVVLPQIGAEEFSNLLYVFYQSPIDPTYMAFMSGASNQNNQNLESFKRYLDISKLAHRFCMFELEVWGKKQLQELAVLDSAANWLDLTHQLELFSYAKLSASSSDDGFLRSAISSLCYAVSISEEDQLIQFYKDVPGDTLEPVLRGVLLVRMLKIGHESWTGRLSWVERGPIYALHMHLLPLPNSLAFNTLNRARDIEATLVNEANQKISLCNTAATVFRSSWKFSIRSDWCLNYADHRVIGELSDLPITWRSLLEKLDARSCSCQGHDCRTLLLKHVSSLMQKLYIRVASICKEVTGW